MEKKKMTSLEQIQKEIRESATAVGRDPTSIRLIAVSKGQPIEKIEDVFRAGQRDFGENYVQEWSQKAEEADLKGIAWHFLGHLQKNKVGKILGRIALFHSLDSFELAKAIDQKSTKPLPSLLEIKLSEESSKTGLTTDVALALIPKLKDLPHIDLRGLMTIPPWNADPEKTRPYFKKLFHLLKEINQRYLYPKPLTELSMGMSADFKIAIEEGATIIRVGEALFGKRAVKKETV